MYKIKKNLSLLTVTDLFEQHYDLRINCQFTISPIWTVYHGSRSISFLGPKIWIILPDRLKNANRIEAFKIQIKKWTSENYPCRLCKVMLKMSALFKGTLMPIWKSPDMFVFKWNQNLENFAFLIQRILELFAHEACNILKSRLIVNIFYCFWMFVNKLFT